MSGAQCVKMDGTIQMPGWPVYSWVYQVQVSVVSANNYLFHCDHYTAATVLTSGFTNGTGQIWLDEVGCLGNEIRLIDCPADPLGQHDCGHSEDAGVSCTGTTCTQGAIRLQGGTATEGRVEVCNNAVWGTVCDDGWDTTDLRVACQQLGLPTSSGE